MAGGGICTASFAELTPEFISATNASIDTLRKSDYHLTVKFRNQLYSGKKVVIRQVRNHFGFGAATPNWAFHKTATVDSAKYDNAFRTYFEWLTPENEMKWKHIDQQDDWSNYDDADSLIAWCMKNDIKVRGHSLFWNEDTQWVPGWAIPLDSISFKGAMKRRITGAVTHFKGKVAHWDLINEIVHDINHAIVIPGMLVNKTGDPDIFAWIFNEARAIDSTAKMGVNEYSVIEYESSETKAYITEIKSIESKGGKIDIVGLEGHFGDYMERSSYLERIDTIANALPGKELWLTEVDFSVDTLVRAEKMEELMRASFAHPRIGGLMLWVWWEGNRWRPYTSFLVDSNFTENELGAKWRAVRNEWRTNLADTTDAEGKISFRGFHGKYAASVYTADSVFTGTFYLEPGSNAFSAEVNCDSGTGIAEQRRIGFHTVPFRLNGQSINMILPSSGKNRLFLSTYTIAGKLLSQTPVTVESGSAIDSKVPSGCYIFKIGTADRLLYAGRGMVVR
ncbi:MAG: endo-1,4-beta-xylanase [Chitinispirillaceae bacterium]|nr:endo-1,4-beta-xylanase [Chitinispirillaceae bacterium]